MVKSASNPPSALNILGKGNTSFVHDKSFRMRRVGEIARLGDFFRSGRRSPSDESLNRSFECEMQPRFVLIAYTCATIDRPSNH